jgi:NAD(P)-dependent dehydrogenase (short-subunit alcohol dehydrogenase family)
LLAAGAVCQQPPRLVAHEYLVGGKLEVHRVSRAGAAYIGTAAGSNIVRTNDAAWPARVSDRGMAARTNATRFGGKVALVTGAASGIGRATALRLAAEGAQVVAADRDRAGLDALLAELPAAKALTYDAADGDASAAMARAAAAAFGRLDCVVCNAGIYRRAHFADISASDWNALFAINLGSVFRIVQAVLPSLLETRGSVVATSSTSAEHGIAYAAHYSAAKAGITALMKSLAIEFASAGIRFNAVAPGRVKTAIGAGLKPLEGADERLATRPNRLAGRLDGGEPDDIAGVIAFLLSDDARYVTGALLTADGAQHLG